VTGVVDALGLIRPVGTLVGRPRRRERRDAPVPLATMDDDARLAALTEALGVTAPDAAEQAAVLDLTRVIAHSSERRFGPLAVYALALAMDPAGAPDQRTDQLRAAIDVIESAPPV
jgi:hypothetical protein